MTPCKTVSFLALGAILFLPGMASGQSLVFWDTFANQTLGETPGAPWTGTVQSAGPVVVEADATNRFGQGVDNRYLRFTVEEVGSTTVQARAWNILPAGTGPGVFTLSYQFIETENSPFNNNSRFVARIYSSDDSPGTHMAQLDLRTLRQGGLLTQNAVHRIDWVVNTTGDSISYMVGSEENTLAGTSSQVWLDGNAVIDPISLNVPGAFTGFDLRTFTNNDTEVLVNEAGVFDSAVVGAAIPEPSAYALFGGLAVLAAALGLRRRRA